MQRKSLSLNKLAIFMGIAIFAGSLLTLNSASVRAESSTYNSDVANKLVTRCDIIRDYLSKTVRIDELAARQNKVRGWEYILRRLTDLEGSYGKFSVDYSELSVTNAALRQQLEQFKVDFEAYDGEFQKLLNINCKTSPEAFWLQLETVRNFRAGITLSSDNYRLSLSNTISKEEFKW